MPYLFKTANWDYDGLTVDQVAQKIAEDDPEFEDHREHIMALAIRVMELLGERSEARGTTGGVEASVRVTLEAIDKKAPARETWGDMARRAGVDWKPGDPVEFKHVIELSSRLSERDAGILGNVWNELGSARGELKALGQQNSELRRQLGEPTWPGPRIQRPGDRGGGPG